jgi:hypothetical protein
MKLTRLIDARPAAMLVALCLLAASSVAFVMTQREKLTRGPIADASAGRLFAPLCDCPNDSVPVVFSLREPDTVTVELLDEAGRSVRTLLRDEPVAGGPVELEWDGTTDAGGLASDGRYQAAITLEGEGRTFVVQTPIELDATAPTATLVRARPESAAPGERIVVRYRLSEPAQAMLYVDGRRVVLVRDRRTEGRLSWFGRAGGAALPPGRYELTVAGLDVAGNVGPRTPPLTVTLR